MAKKPRVTIKLVRIKDMSTPSYLRWLALTFPRGDPTRDELMRRADEVAEMVRGHDPNKPHD